MELEIICGARFPCGFRVDIEYYRRKPKFAAGICARCNGPLYYVRAQSEDRVEGYGMILTGSRRGQVVDMSEVDQIVVSEEA